VIEQDRIRRLIPHAGRMCLWQQVESWDDARIRCISRTHLDPAHPLRRNGVLSAIHLAEYGAQCMALHGGLIAHRDHGGRAAPGVLTSLRDFRMQVQRIDDLPDALHGEARCLVSGATGAIDEFALRCAGQELASGRVSAMPLAQ
jgi:predicted hotdog family 3-hydroxylacyl-ACP dehydratase